MFGFFSGRKGKQSFSINSEYGNFQQNQKETLLDGALRQRIFLPHNCRVGTCRRCEVNVNGVAVLACQYSCDSDATLVYHSLWHQALIKESAPLGSGVFGVSLLSPLMNIGSEHIGQCLDLTFDKRPGSQRKYSIVNVDGNVLTLHITKHPYGQVSSLLASAGCGQKVFISQPQGDFKLPSIDSCLEHGLVFATGSGMGVALTLLEELCSKHAIKPTIIAVSRKKKLGDYHNSLLSTFKYKYPLSEMLCMTLEEVNHYINGGVKHQSAYIVCGSPELNQQIVKFKRQIEERDSFLVQESF